MAEICSIAASSHSPMLSIPSHLWAARIDGDRQQYEDIWEQAVRDKADIFAANSTEEALATSETWVADCISRLSRTLADANPDWVLIVGDDQDELIPRGVTIPFAICTAATVSSRGFTEDQLSAMPEHRRAAVKSTGRDVDRRYVVSDQALPLALELAAVGWPIGLVEGQVDGTGLGHAFTFVVHRLLGGDDSIPLLPFMLNTFLPRIQPNARHCVDLGRAVGRCLEKVLAGRVAVVASGGLSHRMIDPDLDEMVMRSIMDGDLDSLTMLPADRFTDQRRADGTGEIKNWLMVAAIAQECGWTPELLEYRPLYRSPAGTGVGAAFAQWTAKRDSSESEHRDVDAILPSSDEALSVQHGGKSS